MIVIHLDKLLQERNIAKYAFSQLTGIRWNAIDDYCENRVKRLGKEDLDTMCKALKCQLNELIEYFPDEEGEINDPS